MAKATLLVVLFLITFQLTAQNRLKYAEYGGGIGTLNYSGDIATTYAVGSLVKEIRPNFKVFALKHFNDWFAMGANLGYGWFYANDANHGNPNRKFEVNTSVTQLNAVIEANLIRYGKFHLDRKIGLYVQLGGGLLNYNPNLEYGELIPDDIILYPNSYSATSFYFATGFKFRTAYRGTLRLELSLHQSGRDNMDGFQQMDAVSDNDFFGGIGIYYSFLSY